jgi:hypothetical protein
LTGLPRLLVNFACLPCLAVQVREWRGQLAAREAELDGLAAKLAPPRDLELLRVQVCYGMVWRWRWQWRSAGRSAQHAGSYREHVSFDLQYLERLFFAGFNCMEICFADCGGAGGTTRSNGV